MSVGTGGIEQQRPTRRDLRLGVGRCEIDFGIEVRTNHVRQRERRPAARERAVPLYGRLEILDRAIERTSAALRPVVAALEIQIVRHRIGGSARGDTRLFERPDPPRGLTKPRRERRYDRGREGILHRKYIGAGAFEGITPEHLSVARTGELRGETNAVAGTSHGAFHDRAHAQRLAHVGRENCLALKRKTRAATRQTQPRQLGQCVCQFVGEAVAEVLVFRITAGVHEGQHGQRRECFFRRHRRGAGIRVAANSAALHVPERGGTTYQQQHGCRDGDYATVRR